MTTRRSDRFQGLPTALIAALTLLVASFANWVWQWGGTLSGGNAFEAMQNGGSLWESRLGWQLLAFVAAQVTLHLAAGAGCWLLARVCRAAWPAHPTSQRVWTVLWLTLGLLYVLLANAAKFPRSTFGDHLYLYADIQLFQINLAEAVGALLAALAVAAIFTAVARSWRARFSSNTSTADRRPAWISAAAVAMLVSSVALVSHESRPAPAGVATHAAKPNVILLGIDSLRCDVTRASGDGSLTPNIDRFLESSARFTDAMTPLARTYPSWISIFTGKHPHTTGAFVNLLHRDQMQLGDTLPDAFRRAGYRTAYAIDEARFSNIDASYGFDIAITPPMGAADFLIGNSNDTPLSNLVVNTWLGRWLFPFSYANRAAATVYDPDTFVDRLEDELDFEQPTFLALHLTLAHWPYLWADAKLPQLDDTGSRTASHYRPAVRRVDRQFADILAVLERKGALKNAIVVVLSDHGEAIGLPGDSPYAMTGPAEDPYAWSEITGHGTSVLSPHQYRVVLAVREFGAASDHRLSTARDIDAPVSLEDLAPTLNDWLGLRMATGFDGQSLLPLLRGHDVPASMMNRIRFTETEFNPRGFMPGQKQTPSAIDAALRFYEIDRITGRMNIRRSERTKLLRQRQYAAVRGREIIAALPRNFSSGFRYVYIDGSHNGLPRSLEHAPDVAEAPSVAELWSALHGRFSEPLDQLGDMPCPGTSVCDASRPAQRTAVHREVTGQASPP